jgi:acyl-CoA synthetase (AMP-forming)/AMP-acid ligase II
VGHDGGVDDDRAGPGAARTWNDRFLAQWSETDRLAVVASDVEWDGRDLVRRACGAAVWLAERGFREGACVPALVDESPTSLALAAGAALAGCPLAPLGTRLPPSDLARAVRGVGATGLVATADLADVATAVATAAGVPVHLVDELPERDNPPTVSIGPDDVATVVHTSGTTGAPVPVQARHRAVLRRAEVYEEVMPMRPGDRFCSASPFHHTTGINMAFTALAAGATVLPMAWFSVEGWREAGRLGVTHALLVPTMIDQLLEQGALGDARPRVLQYGAAPIDPETLAGALSALPDAELLQIFGQTEVSPLTALHHPDHLRGLADRPELLRSVGPAVPGVDLRIDSPDADGVGELVARAAHAFVTGPDGERRTGDLGRIDADGYLTLHGRVGDRIVWAGENIYPTEVEQALASHPGVRDVAVVGVPDRRYGERVRAVVVPIDPGAPPSAADLRAHAAERLARFKVPTEVRFVDQLPRNAGGKVVRQALLET